MYASTIELGWWTLAVATAALRRKKAHEVELDRLSGTRLQLEMQVNTLESANFNQETMAAMKKGSEALKTIHGNLYVGFLLSYVASFVLTTSLLYDQNTG